MMMTSGRGVRIDFERAQQLMRTSCQRGFARACQALQH
jgi:hypothetical protein